jgi:hypothetical protein
MNPNLLSVLAADPGRQGAIVRLILGRPLRIEFVRIDRLSRRPFTLVGEVQGIVERWEAESRVVGCALEEPFGRPGQGNQLSYGRAFGHLETALDLAVQCDVTLWNPSQWQPKILLSKRKGRTAKEAAAFAFDRLFRLPPNLRPHEGAIDAALLAVVEAVRLGAMTVPRIDWSPFLEPSPQGDSE